MSIATLPTGEKDYIYASFRLQKTGLSPVGKPMFTDWVNCGCFLNRLEKSVQFWVGDWLNYGEKTYGSTYTKALKMTGYDYGTLRNMKMVAGKIELSRRRETISFEIHKEAAALPPDEQEAFLSRAASEQWSRKQTRLEKHKVLQEKLTPVPASPAWDRGLLLGDCVSLLNTLPDNSIDTIITDPPYGLDYQSTHKIIADNKIPNDGIEEAVTVLDAALSAAQTKLKANSHVYIFTSWKTYHRMLPIVKRYLQVFNLLVWKKNNWTAGDLAANYGHVHELIIFAGNGTCTLSQPATNVLHFDRVAENARLHPTEKPLPLLEYLISQSTKPGDTVLDMFMGVGSTCLAARNTGRRYIGIEIDKTWFDLACQRLA
jgi:site-specific DNA-methyltransferase (adenine-specific)